MIKLANKDERTLEKLMKRKEGRKEENKDYNL